jgi:hypothetical protein
MRKASGGGWIRRRSGRRRCWGFATGMGQRRRGRIARDRGRRVKVTPLTRRGRANAWMREQPDPLKNTSYSDLECGLLYELSRGYAHEVPCTLSCMEYARLETATLAHVDDSYYYGAYCRKCKHSARLSLTKLRAHLGDTFPLLKIRDKLRCERCRSRQIVITFLAPDQRTGNLVPLFGAKPK